MWADGGVSVACAGEGGEVVGGAAEDAGLGVEVLNAGPVVAAGRMVA